MYKGYKFSIESIGIVDVETPLGASKIQSEGFISFHQKSPIFQGTLGLNLQNNLIGNYTYPQYIDDLLVKHMSSNFTTTYDHKTKVIPYSSSRDTEIDLIVKIPEEQQIILQAPYLYQLKQAWIQYFSVLVPVVIVIYIIMYYLYTLNILNAYKTLSS